MVYLKYILLAVSICRCISSNAYDYDLELDGIYYTINVSSRTATIVAYPDAKGNVVIPDRITYNTQELKVVGIGDEVFEGNESIVSISCQEPKSIGKETFRCCSNLISIRVPCKFNTIIPARAFSQCTNLEYIAPFEGTYTGIAQEAFNSCRSIKRFTIPEHVTSVGIGAFNGFKARHITVEDSDKELSFMAPNADIVGVFQMVDTICWMRGNTTFVENRGKGALPAKILILGESVNSVGMPFSVSQKVILQSPNPPQMKISFTTSTYINTPLYVPKGSLEKYQSQLGWWSNFFIIKEDDSTSSIKVVEEMSGNPTIYNIKGEKIGGLPKGLNIIGFPDGKYRKVLMKK